MQRIITILMILSISVVSFAQKKVRGVSPPGRIGEKTETISAPSVNSDILCKVSFHEPSGDNVLSEGENGSVEVEVLNRSLANTIHPKLLISLNSSWDPTIQTMTKQMDPIQPLEKSTYSSPVSWKEIYPSGTITYQVTAVDETTGLESEPVEITFNISGISAREESPTIVNVDQKIPVVSIKKTSGIAVIIGNRDYTNPDVPSVDFAIQDAKTVKKYFIDVLGLDEHNIIYIENAKKADFERVFGTKEIFEGKLYNWVKPHLSDVFIYYSGHGAPDLKNKKAYFMPTNGDPNYVKIDGYPLDVLYQNLEKIPAKSITVVLDACFSGGSQQGMLIKNASPMYIDVETPLFGKKFTLFTSASGDQIASWYPEGNHSLFTYYFLRALRGEADKDRNRKITVNEMNQFLSDNVPYMARRLYGREQTPVVKGNLTTVISRY